MKPTSFTTRTRVNGFSFPLSSHQIIVFIAYILSSVLTILLVTSVYVEDELKQPLLAIDVILIGLSTISWFVTSIIDPVENPSTFQVENQQGEGEGLCCNLINKCFRYSTPIKRSTRYCAQCCKSVAGMDHHCTWLNSCIGSRNYIPFICLTFISLGQMIFHVVVGIMALAYWSKEVSGNNLPMGDDVGVLWRFRLLASLDTLISGISLIFLATLASFHIFLIFYVRMGTYDWMLARSNAKMSRSRTVSSLERRFSESTDMESVKLRKEEAEDFVKQLNMRRKTLSSSSMAVSQTVASGVYRDTESAGVDDTKNISSTTTNSRAINATSTSSYVTLSAVDILENIDENDSPNNNQKTKPQPDVLPTSNAHSGVTLPTKIIPMQE